MAKYTYPGIRFREEDNTIRTENVVTRGAGAIVMKANRGPVNQRIMTHDYEEFKQYFGEPESLTDYGHFAAENFFANSTQLYAVRCTMGDEQYAQIQFSYPDAPITARMESTDCKVFKYIDNQADYQLKLLQPLTNVNGYSDSTFEQSWISGDNFHWHQLARYNNFYDITTETNDFVVYKDFGNNSISTPSLNPIIEKGIHVIYPETMNVNGMGIMNKKLLINEAAWTAIVPPNQIVIDPDRSTVEMTLNENQTLNRVPYTVKFDANINNVSTWETSGVVLKDVFKADNFNYGETYLSGDWFRSEPLTAGYGYTSALHVPVVDWEDPTTSKEYYIDYYMNEENPLIPDEKKVITFDDAHNKHLAVSVAFTDYIMNDKQNTIIGDLCQYVNDPPIDNQFFYMKSVSEMYKDETPITILDGLSPRQVIDDLMRTESISDIADIAGYTYIRYLAVLPNVEIVEHLIKETELQASSDLFCLFSEQNTNKTSIAAVYSFETPLMARLPIQSNIYPDSAILNNIIAQPTSYLVNSVDKTYANGYTQYTQSEDEPGNGDIENYASVFDSQFVIAAIGPGEYGNDIGISIITPECANIKALEHPNAFNWKDKYDDEDLVAADGDDLTWKKVFRINVYAKSKNQTAAGAWGTGMDALLKMPVETWYVSTDPLAKDENGQSLYAPTVINGNSDYIYISRSSTSKSLNCNGKYQIPAQTYSIYQLTGGKNSTKDNISEKTAALNFYADRQLANFDILFNVDAIESFSGRQRYNAHQARIAEIAGKRTMDMGVVQVTSKAAKTCKQMISEARMFSFNNPTYVAEYAGYDKYYNSTLASWIYLPKSVAGACAMAYCDNVTYPWMAPAGVARGTIDYSTAQLIRLTDVEIGQLYDINVNCSRDCGNYGTILYGQKTALKKNSLFNRINVRRCLNYIEKELENMMTPYLWAQNSVNTRSSTRNDIDSFLQRVKAAEGIEQYNVSVTQDESDPTIMNVNISVVPISAIEFIDIKISVNRGQVTVAEEQR